LATVSTRPAAVERRWDGFTGREASFVYSWLSSSPELIGWRQVVGGMT
jgi:hypothetical protein